MSAAFEAGQDRMAYDLGNVILDMGKAGRTDSEIVLALEDAIVLRIGLGLPEAATAAGVKS